MKSLISRLNIQGILAFIFFFIIIQPWLLFSIGYISGILAKIFIGDFLVTGINAMLKTSLSKDQIPLIAGTLCWIGNYFKTSTSTSITAKE